MEAIRAKFKVGDVVTYTNDYGVRFPGRTITGIEVYRGKVRYFYAPHDAYWYSVPEDSLRAEETNNRAAK